jgi:SNF2 family DNA or RNA helicase
MNELDAVWTLDPNSKILVFSHYLGFLDIMETQLRLRGISFFRLDGKLSLKERMRVLDAFRSCNIESAAFPSDSVDVVASGGKSVVKRGLVLLMSMNAGGEGLNLVAASSAFVVEPWWNSAREDVRRRKIGLFCLSKQIIVYVSACFSFFM